MDIGEGQAKEKILCEGDMAQKGVSTEMMAHRDNSQQYYSSKNSDFTSLHKVG